MTDLLGHDAVRQLFDKQFGEGRLHHAWLLHGPAGIGKRLLARALAADYLCECNRDTTEVRPACGECHGCRMMAAGSHPDFLLVEREWDEKKKRFKRDVSIEQVRGMLGSLALSGSESMRRVALIGEAERLNVQAANAMLKGLEEPSAGSLLLLVCEDALALPATVRSRCMLQSLSPLGDEPMQRILRDMGIPDQAMKLAKQLANGQPGKVAALADPEIASALLDWHRILADPPALDIGRVQQWISRHVQQVPHGLIVDMVLASIQPLLSPGGDMLRLDAALDAARGLAAWPQELVRRTLRPAPTLLAHMLALRIALRDLQQAA